MKDAVQPNEPTRSRRRFVVHLLSLRDATGASTQFVIRIHPWASRVGQHRDTAERIFDDECEFIQAVNSVLPPGSDVRNIFSQIDSPEGFYYVLQLDEAEARRLGWPGA